MRTGWQTTGLKGVFTVSWAKALEAPRVTAARATRTDFMAVEKR